MKFFSELFQLLFVMAAVVSVAFVVLNGLMAALNAFMGM